MPAHALPVPVETCSTVLPAQVQVEPSRWATTLQPFAPAAAEAARRALLDACSMPVASDPRLLDRLAAEVVEGAVAVAADPAVDGRDRAAAVADARRVIEVVAEARERAEVRRQRWWETAGRGLIVALLVLVMARPSA